MKNEKRLTAINNTKCRQLKTITMYKLVCVEINETNVDDLKQDKV